MSSRCAPALHYKVSGIGRFRLPTPNAWKVGRRKRLPHFPRSRNYLEIHKPGTASMGEEADVQRAIRARHFRLAYLAPNGAVLAGIPNKLTTLTLQLEPARPVGIAIQNRSLIDAAIAIGIPLQGNAVGG